MAPARGSLDAGKGHARLSTIPREPVGYHRSHVLEREQTRGSLSSCLKITEDGEAIQRDIITARRKSALEQALYPTALSGHVG